MYAYYTMCVDLAGVQYAIANYTGLVPQLVSRGWVGALPFGLSVNNRTGPGACCDPGCDAGPTASTASLHDPPSHSRASRPSRCGRP